MYNCKECGKTTEPKQAMLRIVHYREDKSIKQEIPVCPECYTKSGRKLEDSGK